MILNLWRLEHNRTKPLRIINVHKIKRWDCVRHIIIHQHLYWTIKQWQRDLLQVGLCRTWQKVPSRIETFFDGLINVEHYTALSSSALYCTSHPTASKQKDHVMDVLYRWVILRRLHFWSCKVLKLLHTLRTRFAFHWFSVSFMSSLLSLSFVHNVSL